MKSGLRAVLGGCGDLQTPELSTAAHQHASRSFSLEGHLELSLGDGKVARTVSEEERTVSTFSGMHHCCLIGMKIPQTIDYAASVLHRFVEKPRILSQR